MRPLQSPSNQQESQNSTAYPLQSNFFPVIKDQPICQVYARVERLKRCGDFPQPMGANQDWASGAEARFYPREICARRSRYWVWRS